MGKMKKSLYFSCNACCFLNTDSSKIALKFSQEAKIQNESRNSVTKMRFVVRRQIYKFST